MVAHILKSWWCWAKPNRTLQDCFPMPKCRSSWGHLLVATPKCSVFHQFLISHPFLLYILLWILSLCVMASICFLPFSVCLSLILSQWKLSHNFLTLLAKGQSCRLTASPVSPPLILLFFLPFVRPLHPHAPALHSSRIKYLQTVQGPQPRGCSSWVSAAEVSQLARKELRLWENAVRHHSGPCDDREKATGGSVGTEINICGTWVPCARLCVKSSTRSTNSNTI